MVQMAKLSSKLAERQKAMRGEGVVLPAVKTQMLKEFEAGEDRPWDIIHPSELSHQDRFCPRAVFIRITEGKLPPGKFNFVTQNIFGEGNSIHEKWQARLRKAVPLWGDWKCMICEMAVRDSLEPPARGGGDCDNAFAINHIWEYREVNLDARAEALLSGHADGAFGNSLVEFKSVGEGSVRIEAPKLYKRHYADGQMDLKGLWQGISRPFGTHLNQGDIYLWIAQQLGLPFNQMAFVYESKWNQQVKEFVVPYNEARSLQLVDQAKTLMQNVKYRSEPECRFPGECDECKPYDARRATAGRKRTVLQAAEEG